MGFDPVSFAMGAKSGSGGGGSTGGGVLVCNMDAQTLTLDKTWQEIADADYAILKAPLDGGNAYAYKFFYQQLGGSYGVGFMTYDMGDSAIVTMLFVATSADGYPVMQQGG